MFVFTLPFLLLWWLWVTCLLPAFNGYRAGNGYEWGVGNIMLTIIGVLALIAWVILIIGAVHA